MWTIIGLQILTGIIALTSIVLEFIWYDKRTKNFKKARNIFITATLLLIVAGVVNAVYEKTKTDKERIILQKQYDSLNQNFDSVKLKLETTNINLTAIRVQLTPFLQLASKKYPTLNQEEALRRFGKSLIINRTYINAPNALVISNNQKGGITAHTVNLTKPSKRVIKDSVASILNELKIQPIAAFRLFYSSSDPETYSLSKELKSMLRNAGWREIPSIELIAGPGLSSGINLIISKEDEPFITFANKLYSALANKGVSFGLASPEELVKISSDWGDEIDVVPKGIPVMFIFIGPNPEN